MEPVVIDDFLPEVYQDSIYNLLTGSEFPWIFHDYSVNDEYGEFDSLYGILQRVSVRWIKLGNLSIISSNRAGSDCAITSEDLIKRSLQLFT